MRAAQALQQSNSSLHASRRLSGRRCDDTAALAALAAAVLIAGVSVDRPSIPHIYIRTSLDAGVPSHWALSSLKRYKVKHESIERRDKLKRRVAA